MFGCKNQISGLFINVFNAKKIQSFGWKNDIISIITEMSKDAQLLDSKFIYINIKSRHQDIASRKYYKYSILLEFPNSTIVVLILHYKFSCGLKQ